jgi:hypothetical protein
MEEQTETQDELNERMKGLMTKSKTVLFMKGTPDAPRCGFSRKTVALLREQGVEFSHFDILTDESVRAGGILPLRFVREPFLTYLDWNRPKGIEQLAHLPTAYYQWGVCWGIRYCSGNG